ncbi:hypothetical protein D6827_00380 [Candidatus Parcubacteria bacterium]|nr:MAG: hypothetical protein D6827_00380 [Candidatus Parcubacteria bacterium]
METAMIKKYTDYRASLVNNATKKKLKILKICLDLYQSMGIVRVGYIYDLYNKNGKKLSRQYINETLRLLESDGLIQKIDWGIYRVNVIKAKNVLMLFRKLIEILGGKLDV